MQRENQNRDQNRSAFPIIPYSAEPFFFNPKSTVQSWRSGQLEVKQQITNKLELAWHVFLLLGIITKRLNNKSNTHAACCHGLFVGWLVDFPPLIRSTEIFSLVGSLKMGFYP